MINLNEVNLSASRVLVVDDEVNNLAVTNAFLEAGGYSVSSVTSGEQALEIVQESPPPDIILLDIMMKGIDGFEVCRRLKDTESSARNIPVIFMTAKTEASDIVKGFKLGAVDYVTKPYKKEEVCSRVRTHLQIQRLLEERREQAEQFRVIVGDIREALIILDVDGMIRFMNLVANLHFKFENDEALGQSIAKLLADPYDKKYSQYFSELKKNHQKASKENQNSNPMPYGEHKVKAKRKDGSTFSMQLKISEMFLQEPRFLAICYDDSFERRIEHEDLTYSGRRIHEREIRKLLEIAQTDPLTRIKNRGHFDEVFEEEWKRAARSETALGLIILDVDFFKRYNDTYGHAAGDDCLQKVAQVMEKTLNRPTDLVARFGGEEFVILMPGAKESEAFNIGEKIRAAIEHQGIEHCQSEVGKKVLTVSGGVAVIVPDQSMDATQFFKTCDEALYMAKKEGRNRLKLAASG